MNNMKKLLLIFLVFISFASYGQRIQKANTYGLAFNRTGADTLFYLPNDTFTVPAAYLTYPFMARKGANVYIWNTSSNVWQGLTGGTLDTTGAFVTSVYRRSDSVFYVKGGVHTFAFKDSTGGSTPTLQQVFSAEGNEAVITSSVDISPSTTGISFLMGNNGVWHDIIMQSLNQFNLSSNAVSLSAGNNNLISVGVDSIKLSPFLGRLVIDTLNYTLSTTGKKILIRDTATGLVQNIDPSLLGGGSTPTLQQVLTAGSTLTTDNTIDAGTTVFSIGQSGERQLVFDPVTKYWAIGDYAGDFGNATSIHIADSIGEVRVDGYIKLQELKNQNYSSDLDIEFPIFYNSGTQALTAGTGVDSVWRVSDSIHFRVRSSNTVIAGIYGIYSPTAGASYTFTNGLTESGGTVKLGGTLTANTSVSLADKTLVFPSTYYPSVGGIFYNGSSGYISFGDTGPDHNETYISLDDANMKIRLQADDNISLVSADSLLINSNSIRLRTLSNFADTTDWKAVVINNTTGEVRRATYWPGGGGSTSPAGNYGNLQINRNGAFATPGSDSLIWASATGLTSLGNIGVGVTTSTHRVSILDNQTTRDVLKIRNLSASGYSSIGFFGYTDAQVGGFGYANGGIAGPVSDAIYFYSNSKDLVFSKDATATSSMTIRGATGTVGIVNAFIGSATGTATARLHISAGTATASTAPLKFTSGTNLTTAEAGAMEYNGTNLFFTPSSAARNNILMTASVNSVSPTSPNRTITVVIDGTTYYIHAKTTND